MTKRCEQGTSLRVEVFVGGELEELGGMRTNEMRVFAGRLAESLDSIVDCNENSQIEHAVFKEAVDDTMTASQFTNDMPRRTT
jgi:hypothetical protein